MNRLLAIAVAVAACGSPPPPSPAPNTRTPKPPRPTCPEPWTGVADLHVDLPYQIAFRERSQFLNEPGVDVTADTLRAGNVKLLVLSLYWPSADQTLVLDDLSELLATAEDMVEANRELFDELGTHIVYGVEGSRSLGGNLEGVRALVSRGVRIFGLTHRRHNSFADSAQDRRKGAGGLSDAGRELVREVFAAGAIVDVSHASDDAARQSIAIAKETGGVVIATHSNARAIHDHERNLPDNLLRGIASTGGVVGLNFHSRFLRRRGTAIIDDVVAHAAHMIDVIGAEHVALGSDFDGSIRPPKGLETHAQLPALADALGKAGFDGEIVAGIMGRNARRVIVRPKPCDAYASLRRRQPTQTPAAR